MVKKYAVFREPGRVLVGIEPDTFNVTLLAEQYGSGTYEIDVFNEGKVTASFHQVVDDRLGPPKKVEPLPEDLLPSTK